MKPEHFAPGEYAPWRGKMVGGKERIIDATHIKYQERRKIVLEMRKSGASYRQIAEYLGVSEYQVSSYLDTALRQLIAEDVESVRKIELGRLDTMLQGIWSRAIKGELPAVDRALHIMKRRAEIMGLDAPKRIDLKGKIEQTTKNTITFDKPEQIGEVLATLAAQIAEKSREQITVIEAKPVLIEAPKE